MVFGSNGMEMARFRSKDWHQDRYEGEFGFGIPIKVIGQTTDGEVDGKWKLLFLGLPSSETLSKVGLIASEGLDSDGKAFEQTNLKDGTGILCEYNEDGSILKVRQFIKGIGTELEI